MQIDVVMDYAIFSLIIITTALFVIYTRRIHRKNASQNEFAVKGKRNNYSNLFELIFVVIEVLSNGY